MSEHGGGRQAATKTCPICGAKAYAATRKCKTEGCGWNYSLKVLDKDGSIAASNPRGKRNAADVLAGSTYIPTGAAAAAGASNAAAAATLSAARRAAERDTASPPPITASRTGNVTSYSNVSPEDDGNMDSCVICGDRGMLICCDCCPLSFHADCAGLPTIPQGFWSCPQCVAKNQAAAVAAAGGAAGAGAVGGAGNGGLPLVAPVLSGVGLQSGLDAFHQKLNACLDHTQSACFELDGFTFQTFEPPASLDPKVAAAAAKAKAKAAKTADGAATAATSSN